MLAALPAHSFMRCRDSQGFCCRCSADEILHSIAAPLLGGNTQMTRASLNCANSGSRASAHCLRTDDSWWFAVRCGMGGGWVGAVNGGAGARWCVRVTPPPPAAGAGWRGAARGHTCAWGGVRAGRVGGCMGGLDGRARGGVASFCLTRTSPCPAAPPTGILRGQLPAAVPGGSERDCLPSRRQRQRQWHGRRGARARALALCLPQHRDAGHHPQPALHAHLGQDRGGTAAGGSGGVLPDPQPGRTVPAAAHLPRCVGVRGAARAPPLCTRTSSGRAVGGALARCAATAAAACWLPVMPPPLLRPPFTLCQARARRRLTPDTTTSGCWFQPTWSPWMGWNATRLAWATGTHGACGGTWRPRARGNGNARPPPPPPDLPPCLPHPSRSAFRNAQGSSRCSMAPGSCLANQIYNIYYEGEWVAGWMGRRGGGSRAHARFGFTARLAPMRRLYTNPTAQRQRLPPALAGLAPPPSRSGPCGKGPGAPVLYWAVRRGARQHRPGWRHARPPPHTHTPRTHAAALPQSCRPPTSPLSACCTPPPLHSPQMSGEQRNGSLWLSLNLPLPFIKSSLVTLSVAADDVQLVVNRAPARILSAKVRAGSGGGVGWGGVDVCGWGRGAHSLLPGLTASCHVCRPAPRTPAPPSRCAPTT